MKSQPSDGRRGVKVPYIKQDSRAKFNQILDEVKALGELSSGDLNYLLTKVCLLQVAARGERYDVYNSILGTISAFDKEFYRRFIAPYEDKKIVENGDIV